MFRVFNTTCVALVIALAAPLGAHERSQLSSQGDGPERGELRVEGTEIRVRGEHLEPHSTVAILIEDGNGVLTEAFQAETDEDGRFEVRANELGGLPLGATTADAFLGAAVSVDDSDGTSLLSGKFSAEVDEDELGVGVAPLVPPIGSPTPAATGRIKTRALAGRHALEVRVRSLPMMESFDVCVTSPDGLREPLGNITTGDSGNGTLKIDTAGGGSLPLGAGSVFEIAGWIVDVKDPVDGTVLLTGTIPDAGQIVPEEGIEIQFDLARPEAAPEPSINGDVKFQTEPERDTVRVRIDKATPGAEYMARISRPDAAGGEPEREMITVLTADEDGRADFEERGRPIFPLGASSLDALTGTIVEVLRLDGETPVLVLEGTVPEASDLPDVPDQVERLAFEVSLTPPEGSPIPGAHGKVEFEEQDDEHQLEVEVQDLVPGAAYRVELSDGAGNAEALFDGTADSFGDIRQQTLVLGAEPLPLGVVSFRELDGFAITVIDGNSAVVIDGTVTVPPTAAGGTGGGANLELVVSEVLFTTVGLYDGWFQRGDANNDSRVNIADPVWTLEFIFRKGPGADCLDRMDANDDGFVDLSDSVFELVFVFIGGQAPALPGPDISGSDPTVDTLFCKDS